MSSQDHHFLAQTSGIYRLVVDLQHLQFHCVSCNHSIESQWSYYYHMDLRCYGSLRFFCVSTKNTRRNLINSVNFIDITMKSSCKSFFWECLPITKIFPDYYENILQILTELPSCLRELPKAVVPAMTLSLTLWHGV